MRGCGAESINDRVNDVCIEQIAEPPCWGSRGNTAMHQTGPNAFIGKDVLLLFQVSGKSLLKGGQNCGF